MPERYLRVVVNILPSEVWLLFRAPVPLVIALVLSYQNGMSVVFVLGAGASHGDSLTVIDRNPPPPAHAAAPPVTNGFFRQELFESIHYPGATAEGDFPAAFDYIRRSRLLLEAVGIGGWKQLDLEQIFTSVELERTFSNPESDRAAKATLVRNQLVRYIQRILSLCTQFCYGQHYRRLASAANADVDCTIITFNWESPPRSGITRGFRRWHRAQAAIQQLLGPDYWQLSFRSQYADPYGDARTAGCVLEDAWIIELVLVWKSKVFSEFRNRHRS